jgi:hypothetical protein
LPSFATVYVRNQPNLTQSQSTGPIQPLYHQPQQYPEDPKLHESTAHLNLGKSFEDPALRKHYSNQSSENGHPPGVSYQPTSHVYQPHMPSPGYLPRGPQLEDSNTMEAFNRNYSNFQNAAIQPDYSGYMPNPYGQPMASPGYGHPNMMPPNMYGHMPNMMPGYGQPYDPNYRGYPMDMAMPGYSQMMQPRTHMMPPGQTYTMPPNNYLPNVANDPRYLSNPSNPMNYSQLPMQTPEQSLNKFYDPKNNN